MRLFLYALLLLFSTVSFSQTVEFKGNWQQKRLDLQIKNVQGTLNIDNIDIEFETIPVLNIEAIEIRDIDYRKIDIGRTYNVVEKPNKDNEISIDLNIPNTCGDIDCDKGELYYYKLTDKRISGDFDLIFNKDDCEGFIRSRFELPIEIE